MSCRPTVKNTFICSVCTKRLLDLRRVVSWGQSRRGQQKWAITRKTCGENNLDVSAAHGGDHPIRGGLAGGKKTPLVIGVRGNVPLVCHEVLSSPHSTGLTQMSLICLLNRSHRLLSSVFLPSLYPCPRALLPSPTWSQRFLCVRQHGADLMTFPRWWGRACQSCAPALSCSRLREHSSGRRRQLQRQNATEGFRVSPSTNMDTKLSERRSQRLEDRSSEQLQAGRVGVGGLCEFLRNELIVIILEKKDPSEEIKQSPRNEKEQLLRPGTGTEWRNCEVTSDWISLTAHHAALCHLMRYFIYCSVTLDFHHSSSRKSHSF